MFLGHGKSFALLDFFLSHQDPNYSTEHNHLFFLSHAEESDKLTHPGCKCLAKNYIIYLKERSWQKLVLLELVNLGWTVPK